MTLEQIKKFDTEIVTEEIYNQICESEFVETVENLGYSSYKKGYIWYDVTLADETHIDIYSI